MLYSKDIRLVPIEEKHLNLTRSWANSTEIQNQILRTLPVYNENQRKWYTDIIEADSKVVFAIETNKDKIHIGNTGFYNINYLHRRAEFWILIGQKDFQKQNFGYQTTSLMLSYGFRNLNLNKIYLHVNAEHKGAIDLYKNNNFLVDGVLRQHYFIDGSYKDIMTMSLLKADHNEKIADNKS